MRSGGVKFWAWTVSIGVHLIVLFGLAAVRFSGGGTGEQFPAVVRANAAQIGRLLEAAPVVAKPKIKKLDPKRTGYSKQEPVPISSIFETTDSNQVDPARQKDTAAGEILPLKANVPANSVEFFGSRSSERKVCFVVDCSGSMFGLFGPVRRNLKDSIESLQPDQFFYIIFFSADRFLESGNGRLLRATAQSKAAAYEFIDSIRLAGKTNALAALERALKIKDSSGRGASVIYFLTDGFELTGKDDARLRQKLINTLKNSAGKTKINTIAFWPQQADRRMLETIAAQTGGEFVLIGVDKK